MKTLLCSSLFLLIGCSSPYQFSREIGDFSSGVDRVSNAYVAGYDNLTSDRQTYRDLVFADASAKLKLANGCIPGGVNALLCDFYRQGESQPSPSDPALAASRQRTLDALSALQNYAHALQAITNAADRAAFNSAAARLNAAVTALLEKVPNPAVAASSAVFSASFNVVAWVFGQALDQQRFETLRHDVNLAVAPVRSIAKGLGTRAGWRVSGTGTSII